MANRFWIGGTGNTSDTAHWSATSGGGGGVAVPVAGDIVTFDTNSGTGTVTDNAGLTCASITHTQASLTVTATAAQTVTGAVTISAGTWVTGAFTHSYGSFVSTSGTRTLTLTNSTINVTGTSGTPWNVAGAGLTLNDTGTTYNVNGGTVNSALSITPGNITYAGTFNVTAAGIITLNNTATFKAFSYTSTSDKRDNFKIGQQFTISAAGALTIAGNSVVNRAFISSNTLGTQRSISVPSGATVTLTNVDFQDIASAGTFGTWTGTSLGDCLGNSGITFDASVSLTLASTGTINWSSATWTSSGAARTAPLPQDDVSLGSSSTATTLTADMPRLGRNIDSSGYLKTLSFASTPNTIFGNITLGASATYSGTQALTLAGRGAQTITSNTKSFPQATLAIAAFGGSYTLQDAFNASALQLNNGTFIDGGFTVGIPNFSSASSGTQAMTMTGTWSLSQATATVWQARSGLTLTATGSTIKFTGTVSTNITFAGNGFTYGTLNWSSTASTGTLIITGANTFAALQSDNTTARTIRFPASTTQTFAAGGFQVSGRSGFRISLTSSSAGTVATLSCPSGRINSDYLDISDSAATGGAQWFAGQNSLNTTPATTTGWLFTSFLAISGGGQMLLRGVGG